MKERKDRYRAALQRGGDIAARSSKIITLNSRYIRMTIEVDPDLQRDLTRWASLPVSALVLSRHDRPAHLGRHRRGRAPISGRRRTHGADTLTSWTISSPGAHWPRDRARLSACAAMRRRPDSHRASHCGREFGDKLARCSRDSRRRRNATWPRGPDQGHTSTT